jgi:hypothetical protein
MASSEEVGHGLGEVSQRLLLYRLAASPQPPELFTSLGQLAALLGPARRSCATRTPPQMLLTRQVPYEPSISTVAAQRRLLYRRWI